jgi:hypothetical protein
MPSTKTDYSEGIELTVILPLVDAGDEIRIPRTRTIIAGKYPFFVYTPVSKSNEKNL